ncbi:hypothetical protein, partial [Xanthomonas nasturtii]|uniref:hypothetical protein n=1 Tax=Xanthomonas nasturtii TaxID=1843581 RepID=UPI00201219F1
WIVSFVLCMTHYLGIMHPISMIQWTSKRTAPPSGGRGRCAGRTCHADIAGLIALLTAATIVRFVSLARRRLYAAPGSHRRACSAVQPCWGCTRLTGTGWVC